jgi:hypothetical protein
MTPLSYPLAGASCLPIVGPCVSIYNAWKVNAELSAIAISNAFGALVGRSSDHDLPIHEKGFVYSICGIVGNVLSTALLVSLAALGILRGSALVYCAIFAAQAVALGYNAYQHNQAIVESSSQRKSFL